MTEFEYKSLLSKEEYEGVLKKLSDQYPSTKRVQINYFYDTPDFKLDSQSITLRARQKGAQLKLQLKTLKDKTADAVHISNEQEWTVSELPLQFSAEQAAAFLGETWTEPLHLTGSMTTERIHFVVDNDTSIDLDNSLYLGTVDYEIEVESTDVRTPLEVMGSILKEALEQPSVIGKRARFYKQLQHLRQNNHQ